MQKERHEQRDVARALAQQRHGERENIQAIKQITPEFSLGDGLAQITIRRGDDAHVDLDRLAAADGFKLLLLQHAEQFDLRLQRQVADFIEENGAAIRDFETPIAIRQRAGERSLHMAKQFALDQSGADGSAVHFHQRAVVPRAAVMDGAGHEFLARARLADDQHRRICGRNLINLLEQTHQRRTVPDDFAEVVLAADFLLEITVLRFESRLLAFHPHALGDVHEHGARVGAARIRARPPLDPKFLAIVLAAQFEHHAARVNALADGLERLLHPRLRLGCVRREGFAVSVRHVFSLDAERLQSRLVRADEFGIQPLVHVGDRRFLEQIAQSLFALLKLALEKIVGAHPLQLDRGAVGKRLHDRERERIVRHGFVVEADEMTDDAPVRAAQRHTEITDRAHVNHASIVGENVGQMICDMADAAFGDFEAGRAGQIILEVFAQLLVFKKSERTRAQVRQAFRHEHPAHAQPLREVAHERVKKILPGHGGRAFDDGLEKMLGTFQCREPRGDLRRHGCARRVGCLVGFHSGAKARAR